MVFDFGGSAFVPNVFLKACESHCFFLTFSIESGFSDNALLLFLLLLGRCRCCLEDTNLSTNWGKVVVWRRR